MQFHFQKVEIASRLRTKCADNIYVDIHTISIKISRSENLPVLPVIVLNLLKLFADDNVSSQNLMDVIGQDSGLTTKVLRVASSPAYGTGHCENIARAISLIGLTRMKQIAVSLAYQQISHDKPLAPSFDKLTYWKHCKVTSMIAREIMVRVNRSKQEDAFVAGLIHDVGLLAMERFCPDEFEQAISLASSKKLSLVEAENQSCGFTHKQVSEVLAKRWTLAPFIQDAISNHDQPDKSSVDRDVCCCVAIANTLSYELGFPPVPGIQASHKSEEFLPLLELTSEVISEISEMVLIEHGEEQPLDTLESAA